MEYLHKSMMVTDGVLEYLLHDDEARSRVLDKFPIQVSLRVAQTGVGLGAFDGGGGGGGGGPARPCERVASECVHLI